MHTIESELDVYELHRQIVQGTDSAQRANAISTIRNLIREERRASHSAEEISYLQVAEMVLNFLEESPNSQDGTTL